MAILPVLLTTLVLLFSPSFLFRSTAAAGQGFCWTHGMEGLSTRPFILPYPEVLSRVLHQVTKRPEEKTENQEFQNTNPNKFAPDKFRQSKRFDEAQIQEILSSNDETNSTQEREAREEEESKSENLHKLMTRLKRSAEEDHISIGKEYITRLGKRSYWISPLARHWMLIKQRIMKKEKKI